jgi:sodium/potassium/calcium exchanger 2
MAVSSSIGSNIFDVSFGLPIPWLIYSLCNNGKQIDVTSDALFISVGILLIMLVALLLLIMAFGWKLTRRLGGMMIVLYGIFFAQDLLRRQYT